MKYNKAAPFGTLFIFLDWNHRLELFNPRQVINQHLFQKPDREVWIFSSAWFACRLRWTLFFGSHSLETKKKIPLDQVNIKFCDWSSWLAKTIKNNTDSISFLVQQSIAFCSNRWLICLIFCFEQKTKKHYRIVNPFYDLEKWGSHYSILWY